MYDLVLITIVHLVSISN